MVCNAADVAGTDWDSTAERQAFDSANRGMRSTQASDSMNANTVNPSQLQLYFSVAMNKFIRDHDKEEVTRSSKKGHQIIKSDTSKVSKGNPLNRTAIDRANSSKTIRDSAT